MSDDDDTIGLGSMGIDQWDEDDDIYGDDDQQDDSGSSILRDSNYVRKSRSPFSEHGSIDDSESIFSTLETDPAQPTLRGLSASRHANQPDVQPGLSASMHANQPDVQPGLAASRHANHSGSSLADQQNLRAGPVTDTSHPPLVIRATQPHLLRPNAARGGAVQSPFTAQNNPRQPTEARGRPLYRTTTAQSNSRQPNPARDG